jgi:hypothetical protein
MSFVRFPFAARRSPEDFGVGARWISVVVQAAGSWGVQTAKGGRRIALGRVAGERVSNDPGWHRCFETETRAALRTEREKWQRKRPIKIAAQKKKKEKEKV